MTHIQVEKLTNPEEAFTYLTADRTYAAYAIGAVDTVNWASNTLLVAKRDECACALFLLSQPFETAPTLFLMGDPSALEEVFHHPLAPTYFAWTSARDEHMECLKRHWRVEDPESMLRMVVTRETFSPDSQTSNCGMRSLVAEDHRALVETYETAFGGAPANMRLLERGPYFGVWYQNQLVSVAGTHFQSPTCRIAAVGNVWTAPAYRNQRLATTTVGAVTQKLLETCDDVVLNVREDNPPARHVYERLGYRIHCRFWQIRVRWKGL
jgi:RimJ/RimL family protein N-acetyltransferase